jgi:signal transduction histidine kinase
VSKEPLPPDALISLSRAVTAGRLLSSVIHQINNALLVITGTTEVLESRTDLPERATRGLERIHRQAERMAASIRDVTSFTKDDFSGPAGNVDLNEVVRDAVTLRRYAVERAGHTIEPAPATQPCIVWGHSSHLRLAAVNLITAAEQGMDGQAGHIAIAASLEDGWGVIRVTDSRRDFPREESAFEPFDGSRTPSDMSGLALAAARLIAEQHGGTVAMELNAGSVVAVFRVKKSAGS